ncbi:MAG: ArsR/SmtB family transcription factor [Terriglobales bacterium]
MRLQVPASDPIPPAQWLRVLRALADPTRYRMVAELAAADELSCGQMGERFPLAQPTISHHIKILTEAGLLRVRRQGQHAYLSLDRAVLRQALAGAEQQFGLHPKPDSNNS